MKLSKRSNIFDRFKNSGSNLLNFIRNMDNYGVPVKLNFKGKDSYQTLPGGILSLILLLLMATFTAIKGKRLLMKEDWIINQ